MDTTASDPSSIRPSAPSDVANPRWTKYSDDIFPSHGKRSTVLQWDYPQSFLYSNSETAAKVAYAQTIYHFSSAAGSAQSPTPGEITAYFTERQHDFENASSQDRWKLANTAVLGVATLAGGVGALYGAETLTVGTLLQASPALIGGSGNAVSSINDAMKMSDADLNTFLSNKVNENLPNICFA